MWAEGREQQLSPSSLPPPLAHSLAHTGVARERASHPAVRRRREYVQFRYEWMKIWQLHTDRDVWNTISGSGWPVRCYVLLGPHLEQQRAVCLLLRNAISPKWSSACFFFFFFSTLGFYLVGRLESCVRVYVCLCVFAWASDWRAFMTCALRTVKPREQDENRSFGADSPFQRLSYFAP